MIICRTGKSGYHLPMHLVSAKSKQVSVSLCRHFADSVPKGGYCHIKIKEFFYHFSAA